MDLELDEIFQWHTPFCTLDQIDLPELYDDLILDTPAVDAVETNLSSSTITSTTEEPVSSPLWPCDLQSSALNRDGILALPSVQLPAPQVLDSVGSPQSSTVPLTRASQEPRNVAPVTPAVAKPKRTRAKRRAAKSTPKAKKHCPESAVVAKCPKKNENQSPTQAEHIIRERQRRDDMAAKYLILESLLPPAPKRERAVVVESAMLLVKDLQQKRSDLLKRRAQLKLMAPNHLPRQQLQSKKPMSPHDSSGFVTVSRGRKLPVNCRTDSPISSSMVATQQELATSPSTINPPTTASVEGASSSGSAQQLHIHVHFCDEEIVIDMVCHQPRQNFQSFLLQAVESFGMDVVRCSIQRVPHGFVQCTFTCTKSQAMNASLATSEVRISSSLIGVLKNVLTPS